MTGRDWGIALIIFAVGLTWGLALRWLFRTARATERAADTLDEHKRVAERIEAETAKRKEGK